MVSIQKLETLDLDGTTSVAPAAVISYADIQNHLKLDGSADQSLVESLIGAVTNRLEAFTNLKFITQVWSIYFDGFPMQNVGDQWWDGTKEGALSQLYANVNYIDLPFGPCQSVAFLKTYDQSENGTQFDSSNYSVDTIGAVGRIALKIGSVWPATVLRSVNGLHIRGTFGFGGTASVPLDIKEAVKISVAKLYENRGDVAQDQSIPPTAQMLLEPYRRWKLR